ncbi:MAG: NADH-quinone oxidoreductase subunit M [Cyanobacteria bacterium SIG31]|nr:NADH-quinone oxidoreductase subunit M [Cyanobacteria bacterium SIG31]
MEKIFSIPFLVFMPMLMSFFIMSPFFTSNEISIRRFAKGVFSFHFLYATLMLIFFDSANPYFSQIHLLGGDWVQSLGIKFAFQIDSISIILVALTSFIFLLASISSKMNIRMNHKFYYSMMLLLMSAILGIFTANDMFLFFMFWELELIPAYFLIGGKYSNEVTPDAKKSATKFVLFTFLGSMFMLLGILLLHYYNYVATGTLSATFSDVIDSYIPVGIQLFIAICLIIGFGVKLPIVPLHTWLPDAHTNAPTPVSIILAGILLKTGAYGIYRFNYEMMGESFKIVAPVLAVFAFLNIIYIAFVAYAQTDIKRIVAYSSISNMGLILLGLCACNQLGLSASVFHMVAHALVTAGLFTICGIVYLRCKTRDIRVLGGIAQNMPRLFGFATLIVLASIGIPVFAPFISEILTIISALFSDLSIVLKITSILSLPLLIASSCYMLKFLHEAFFGEKQGCFEKVNDISVHEFVILASVVAGLVLFGLYPNAILNFVGAI